MNRNQIRAISSLGILVALVLCVLYLIRTYQEGNPRWYFLIMAMGILIMLSYNLFGDKKRKK